MCIFFFLLCFSAALVLNQALLVFVAKASFWEGKKLNVLDWRGSRIVGNGSPSNNHHLSY